MPLARPLSAFYRPRPMSMQEQSAEESVPAEKDPVEEVLNLAKAKLGQKAFSEATGSQVATPQVLNGTQVGMGPTPAFIPAAVALSTLASAKAGADMLHGKTPEGPSGKYGRAQLAFTTMGGSEVANKIKKVFGGRGNSHLEDQKRAELAKRGINLTGEKGWELNEKFRQKRNEDDLFGKDIVGAAAFYDIPGWENASDEARLQVADEALRRKAFREHNGGADVDIGDPEFQKFISQRIADPRNAPGGVVAQPRGGDMRRSDYVFGRDGPNVGKAEIEGLLANMIKRKPVGM